MDGRIEGAKDGASGNTGKQKRAQKNK